MLIEVIHRDYRVEQIEAHQLDAVIDSGNIIAFRRSSGLVLLGMDPVRQKTIPFSGADRRKRTKKSISP
jgi:hypothetical protein